MNRMKSTLAMLCLISTCAVAQTSHTGIRDITALEVTAEMGPGANLWNTLDANCGSQEGLDSETCWGNPVTTPEMIADIKNRGFKTLRIPVTWYNHMGDGPDYQIDQTWMNRVEQVANYAFDNDMYVILNIHHDDYDVEKPGTWLSPTDSRKAASIDQLEKVWLQIANRFKEYGDYLIFETMNEPRAVGTPEEWSGGSAEHRAVVNEFNLAAVNAIRSTGGNNADRFIMIPQVGATGHGAIQDLSIPNDDEKIIVSIHNYGPFSFTLEDPGTNQWGTPQEVENLQNDIKSYYDAFISKGRAVVIGEWGAADKNNLAHRVKYYEVFTQACIDNQIPPINWIYSYDRATRTWTNPVLEDAMFSLYNPEEFNSYPDLAFKGIDLEELAIAGSDVSFELDASDPDGEITHVDLYINNQLVSRKTSAPYLWNGQGEESGLNNLSNGSYTIRAEATDNDNQTSIKVVALKVIQPTSVPTKMEAENFIRQSGVQSESTTDTGGGQNIGFIENSDWSEYFIYNDEEGMLEFTARVASANEGGFIDILIDGSEAETLEVDGDQTNGWQDWYTTESIQIELSEGNHTLTLNYRGGSGFLFNLNWLNVVKPIILNTEEDFAEKDKGLFPNPSSEVINLTQPGEWSIYTPGGALLIHGTDHTINVSHLKRGIYVLRQGLNSFKFIKN